jgi:branched-chain amino acid transport system ATP-binding protein
MSSSEKVLEIIGLRKNFGGVITADNVNITVREREIYGIIGPNGAGKTTLFNMISGLFLPTGGQILLYGKNIAGLRADQISVLGVARTFQNIRLFNTRTVYENLLIACQKDIHYNMLQAVFRTPGFRRQEKEMRERCEAALKQVNLYEVRNMQANKLPYGMQRRLEIMRALMTGPKILLLDEPAAGMNKDEMTTLTALILNIRETYNLTIVIIDHHMDVIMNCCEQITVINFGEQLVTGTPKEVQTNQAVIDAYLGVDD